MSLESSFAHCRATVARAGSSFALGMRLFPRARRDGVYAMYAFFRHTDDLADAPGVAADKLAALGAWREQVLGALRDGAGDLTGCLPAVVDAARRYALPERLFTACIEACVTDADTVRMPTWDALNRYCDGVAGTVGEACLRILGYHGEADLDCSRANARAVQLTNILRDVAEDAARDRVYLPAELLERHAVPADGVACAPYPPALVAALEEAAGTARAYYQQAEPLFARLAPGHRPAIVAMTLRYRLLLDRLARTGFAPGARRGGKAEKGRVLLGALLSPWLPTWHRSSS
ncbi:MAG: phytoene/squalene synthase family protein [Armatimonadetes bacterium]|nr:phytoene/squalene synthase family protein [Armatimonadota bacterium]